MADAVVAEGLTRDFGPLRAVDNLNLRVARGEVFGFLGPNGAGKTTTLHLLLGVLAPTAGSGQVAGHDVATEVMAVRKKSGVLLEHHGLYERLSAYENLEFAARLHGLDNRADRIRSALDTLGYWDRRKERVGKWSKGMKQQLAIARATLHDPEVIFLDEPTNGFDPPAAAALRERLRQLARSGRTIFLNTHNLAEAEAVCDRVAVIHEGRLRAVGRPGELAGEAPNRLVIEGGPFGKAIVAAVKRVKGVATVRVSGDRLEVDLKADVAPRGIVQAIVGAGGAVDRVDTPRAKLEQDFLAVLQEAKA